MGNNALTSRMGALWIQPEGPNHQLYYLGCKDLGDLTDPDGGIDLLRCFAPSGNGWVTKGEKLSPPDKVSTSIDGLMFKEYDWLETVNCPFTLFILQRDCGRPDILTNYVRGKAVSNARRTNKKYSKLVTREEDTEATFSADIEAWPPAYDIRLLTMARQTTASTNPINDINMTTDLRCYGACGSTINPGDTGLLVTDSAVAPAFGTPQVTVDAGVTWTNTAANPFAAGRSVMSGVRFYIGRSTIRLLVAMDAPAAAQGMVAYSDNNGVTWTTVNVGGAAAGHGAVYGRGLFALDSQHIWLAGAAGYIYFSADGGETWTAQESGGIMANAYNFVHFVDEKNGFAGGVGGVCATTNDGQSWVATAVPVAAVMYSGWMLDENRLWVCGAGGWLGYSNDGGATWTQRTGWVGSGVGNCRGIAFAPGSDLFGFLATNTAGVIGSVLRTFDGGFTWDVVPDCPANSGFNGIYAVDTSTAWVVGEVNAAAGFVGVVKAV